jgi:3-methylcrotonyl-CoA carboxylase alpha subunit
MLSSVLIANRGEIACRIIRTAKKLGIRTIAVYSQADKSALHTELADEAYAIGSSPAQESYLNIETLLKVAEESGAQSVHPGYGFLSENAAFASACERAGVIFIGPSSAAIAAMGEKGAAKRLMQEAGVPVVPGYHGPRQDDDFLAQEAARIGYPVLIKAVAGGGGKGIRRVDEAKDFLKSLAAARREGKAAFGDETVLVERCIGHPRHIEIQLFADRLGNVVHLFERDCSLQRRHQKVVEEAPAPGMPQALRDAMGQAAITAATAIGYRGAGTVEFIVDASNGLEKADFFFMEMNTRLQVEHPVTEMITGLDLVEWQFRVAQGESLPITQAGLQMRGHAIEVRLYAEDPGKKFFPSPGKLARLRFPPTGQDVRVESGLREGDEVTIYYDPMIAKLVVWGSDREAARVRLVRILGEVDVEGIKSNARFLREIAGHPAFAAGHLHTGFIDQHLAELVAAERTA